MRTLPRLALLAMPALLAVPATATAEPVPSSQPTAAADRPTPAEPATTRATTPAPFRAVDWANRDYGRHMRLRDGRYAFRRYGRRGSEIRKRCMHTTQSARLIGVHFGDLNADGKQDALVQLATYADYCYGRPQKATVLIAFTTSAAGVVELARTRAADVQSVHLSKSTLHIERREARADAWYQCKERWRVVGAKLQATQSRCSKTR